MIIIYIYINCLPLLQYTGKIILVVVISRFSLILTVAANALHTFLVDAVCYKAHI